MPIRVTCPGCHTRFNVSDKFAGKEGPCPKCKKVIKVPDKSEEVVIHAPENLGPADTQGRPVLKPIERNETNLSQVQIVLVVAVIIGFFALAFMMRIMSGDKQNFPAFLLWLGAIGIAVPVVFSTYSFLKDQELGSFTGSELWMRVGICSAVYAALWFAMPLMEYAFDGYELGSWASALGAMIGLGAAASMLMLDFDYLMGLVHASIYYGICIIGRLIVGIGVFPGMEPAAPENEESTTQLWNSLSLVIASLS